MERKIAIMCPTRNRKANLEQVYGTWEQTNAGLSVLFPVIDDDNLQEYEPRIKGLEYIIAPKCNMNFATNYAADILKNDFTHVMFIGDDHLFRTPNWDKIVLEKSAAHGDTGVFYCDDLLQRERLATEVIITSNIIKAIGYFSIPELTHMYMDNYWMILGKSLGKLVYIPEVVVEHMHPSCGKALQDENYARVGAPEIYSHDQQVLQDWVATKSMMALAKVALVLERNIKVG